MQVQLQCECWRCARRRGVSLRTALPISQLSSCSARVRATPSPHPQPFFLCLGACALWWRDSMSFRRSRGEHQPAALFSAVDLKCTCFWPTRNLQPCSVQPLWLSRAPAYELATFGAPQAFPVDNKPIVAAVGGRPSAHCVARLTIAGIETTSVPLSRETAPVTTALRLLSGQPHSRKTMQQHAHCALHTARRQRWRCRSAQGVQKSVRSQ